MNLKKKKNMKKTIKEINDIILELKGQNININQKIKLKKK